MMTNFQINETPTVVWTLFGSKYFTILPTLYENRPKRF